MHDGTFWENVKPTQIPESHRPDWMTFDDAWVMEVRRGFKACSVFLCLPLYFLIQNQLSNNLRSQSATLQLHGVPNDLIVKIGVLMQIILLPILDYIVFPAFRSVGFHFTPIKKITAGFFFGSAAMLYACILQFYM